MPGLKRLLITAACLVAAACGDGPRLPFPTPGQHDLVVLVQPGLLTWNADENGNPAGLEYDLTQAFAQELGVDVRYVVASAESLESELAASRYHLATAWLSPDETAGLQTTPPLFQTRDILIQHDAALPLTETTQLEGKTVHVLAHSRQAKDLHRLAAGISGLKVVEVPGTDVFGLLEQLAERRIDYAAVDDSLEDIVTQQMPSLRATLPLSDSQPIVWGLGRHPNAELKARVDAFVERVQHDGTLARFEDRYVGHVRRLRQQDIVRFLGEIETTLPKYEKYFEAAQALTGLDWRLLAAVSYQESQWDPNATSHTNVRGIMMLTEETADRLQVGNRLDPAESILAGARYIMLLKEQLPDDLEEPDRTWQALAAYNIGPGHFAAARTLAEQRGVDPNSWYDMKRVLPQLAQPKVARELKIGRARGGEAVILVENIRNYYDILQRNAPPFAPTTASAEDLKRIVLDAENRRKAYARQAATRGTDSMTGMAGKHPLKLPTIEAGASSETMAANKN